jgi:hypothetical protein
LKGTMIKEVKEVMTMWHHTIKIEVIKEFWNWKL